jgi:hypothetical protein
VLGGFWGNKKLFGNLPEIIKKKVAAKDTYASEVERTLGESVLF